MQLKYKYEEMLPQEFLEAVEKMPVFFVPTGLLEWHGDHLPLGQDSLKAHGICLEAAKRLGGGIVLPPCYFGRPGYSRYIGTLTFSEGCVTSVFTELFEELQKVGAKIIYLLTGHYGPAQMDTIKHIAQSYQKEHPEITVFARAEYEGVLVDGEVPGDHAAKYETSIFSYLYPHLTHMENFSMETDIKRYYNNPRNDYYKESGDWEWPGDLRDMASPALGRRCVDAIVEYIVECIKEKL